MNTARQMPTRILIVCEHASAQFGGEAVLPLQYFRILRRRGYEAWLLAHARTREELIALMPEEADRMHFVPDTVWNKLMWRVGRLFPAQVSYFTFGYVSRLATQLTARKIARRLVSEFRISVLHQPIPVSPREPSLLHTMGAAVVIGPMNGNMSYPPAFAKQARWKFLEFSVSVGRFASAALHRLMPGKLRAKVLLVANERTRQALPDRLQGEVLVMPENGVDLAIWFPRSGQQDRGDEDLRFVFVGRLVDWKAVDILLEAFADLCAARAARLDIIGDGPMRQALESRARELAIQEQVRFLGWRQQPECAQLLRNSDVLVLPSIYECGGAVVLEAMATGIPVIAAAWGGPADYLDSQCGLLVRPDSRADLRRGLREAMQQLSDSPHRREALGQAGRAKVEREYDWERKVSRMLEIYRHAAAGTAAGLGEPLQ